MPSSHNVGSLKPRLAQHLTYSHARSYGKQPSLSKRNLAAEVILVFQRGAGMKEKEAGLGNS